jgi:hypothetical protein
MNHTAVKVGFRSGMLAVVATIAFVIAQALQLAGLIQYPWDEILIYGFSLCIVVPFLFEMLALHYLAPPEKKIWSHAALLFTIMYAVFVVANYVVQLATVIPMTVKGEAGQIGMLVQSPHSLFWDFDAVGYICMGLAMVCAIPVFGRTGFPARVRTACWIHGVGTTPLIAFVYFYPDFSETLLLFAIPWAITAPVAMAMIALLFRKKMQDSSQARP